MLKPTMEQVIVEMHKRGVAQRAIARQLKVSRNTVKNVLQAPTEGRSAQPRQSNYEQHLTPIRELFAECRGNVVRVAEELNSRHGITIPYQTLTWLVRKHQIRNTARERAGRYHFEPGEEMQHDTSPHRVELAGQRIMAQCAALTLACSRKLFIQYYPRFTRFECKVFLTEALSFMQGSCRRCVIDNTSVIVSHGAGPDAQIACEMEALGRIYGFVFMPHRIGHADRKARVERSFDYVEKNFLAGRTFSSWHDLNRQAREWCEKTANLRIKQSLGMSPQEAFLLTKHALRQLPMAPPPVYVTEQRIVDVEGYIHLDTNRYSAPDTLIGEQVEVQKHWDKVMIYHGRNKVGEHERELTGRDRRITAHGHHRPLTRWKAHLGPCAEEKLLTGHDEDLDRYVAELKKRASGRGMVKLRQLLELKRVYPAAPFMKAIRAALTYGLYDLARLEKMILKNTSGDFFEIK